MTERVREKREGPLGVGMSVPKGPQSRPPDIGGGRPRESLSIVAKEDEERVPMNRPTRDTFRSSVIRTCVKKQSWNVWKKRGAN